MPGMSAYTQRRLLDHVLAIAAFSMPTEAFLSLHNTDPTDAGSHGGEVSASGTGYARQTLDSIMSPTDLTTGLSQNTTLIVFGPATADWGSIGWVGVEDGATEGANNMLLSGQSSASKTIVSGQLFQLAPQQLSIRFD